MAYSKKYRQARKATRSTVKWKDNTGAKPAPFAKQQQKQRFYSDTIDADLEALRPWLEHGALWVATAALSPNPHAPPTEFPYLGYTYVYVGGPNALVMPGAIAVYAGAVHVDEARDGHSKTVRVWRHTFVVSGGRYVIIDLQRSMEPVK